MDQEIRHQIQELATELNPQTRPNAIVTPDVSRVWATLFGRDRRGNGIRHLETDGQGSLRTIEPDITDCLTTFLTPTTGIIIEAVPGQEFDEIEWFVEGSICRLDLFNMVPASLGNKMPEVGGDVGTGLFSWGRARCRANQFRLAVMVGGTINAYALIRRYPPRT